MKSFEDIDIDAKTEEQKATLRACDHSYDELLDNAAFFMVWSGHMEDAYNYVNDMCEMYEEQIDSLTTALETFEVQNKKNILKISELSDERRKQYLFAGRSLDRKLRAKHAANTRHSKPGGSREIKEKIRAIWATGKYSSRDICAEQECAALGISFSTARKALINTPTPE